MLLLVYYCLQCLIPLLTLLPRLLLVLKSNGVVNIKLAHVGLCMQELLSKTASQLLLNKQAFLQLLLLAQLGLACESDDTKEASAGQASSLHGETACVQLMVHML